MAEKAIVLSLIFSFIGGGLAYTLHLIAQEIVNKIFAMKGWRKSNG